MSDEWHKHMTNVAGRIRHKAAILCCGLEVGANKVHTFMPQSGLENRLVIWMNVELDDGNVGYTVPSS